MERAELVKALSHAHALGELEFLRTIGAYLQTNSDPDIIPLVERSFGMPFADLQFLLQGGGQNDFATTYKGRCAWLQAYLNITMNNEAPGIFHALSALTVASVVMGRRVWVPMGFYKVWPSLSVILVGPSGLRKTIAMNTAVHMLDLMEAPDLVVVREKFTPEALLAALVPDGRSIEAASGKVAFVVSPELSVTLGKASYLEGMIPLVTRLLDQDGIEVRTRGRGVVKNRDIGFGFLGATTPEWITEEMHEGVVSGGFTSRFLVSYAVATPRLIYRFTGTIADHLTRLGEELLEAVSSVPEGAVPVEPTADVFLEQWYKAHKLTAAVNTVQSGYTNRKLTNILRIALIFAILGKSRTVTTEHILEAIGLLDYIEPGMFALFKRLGLSQTAKDAEVLKQLIAVAGKKCSRRMLMQAGVNHMTLVRYGEAMAFLEQSGQLGSTGEMLRLKGKEDESDTDGE